MTTDLRVREIIAEFIAPCAMSPEEMLDETHLTDDLGADSVELIEIQMALEEEFGIEVSDEAAEYFHRVRDVVKFVRDAEAKSAS